MKALVAGAGVAGPLVAMALQQAGIEAEIVERHDRPDPEVGAWFTISPNGLDALAAIGVLDLAKNVGIPTRRNVLVGATGRELGRLPLGKPLSDGTPALTMKRSRLTAALVDECGRRDLPIHWGSGVDSAHDEGDHVVVSLGDGSTRTADLLVGADGVHSRTRRIIDPTAPPARYVGLTNFGGVTPGGASLLDEVDRVPEQWRMVFGRRAFFGHHVTPDGDVVWFVNPPRPAITPDERASTTAAQWQAHLVDLTAGDSGPAPRLIEAGRLELAADNTHDLAHVPTWHRNRMVVIGDAAHAPAPSSGQGASMAAEDAVVLAQCLRDARDVPTALTAYEMLRRDRVERIVRAGARTSSIKSPGTFQQLLLRAVLRFAVTEKSAAWITEHRLDWDARIPETTR